MTKDDRLYARFSLDFPDHPKIAGLSDRAFRTLIEMTIYSRRMLSDGFIDGGIASKKWKKQAIYELTTNDPERPSVFATEREGRQGFQLHDYAAHQQTRADIDAKRDAGRKGGIAKASKPVAPAMAPASDVLKQTSTRPLAITEPEPEPKEKNVSELRPDVSRLCNLLADLIESNGSKRPAPGKGWFDAARLLLDADHRAIGEAITVMRWCQADPFWRANILSLPKFREKYDQLRLQREAQTGGTPTQYAPGEEYLAR